MKPGLEFMVANRLRQRRLHRNVPASLRITSAIHNRTMQRWLRAVEAYTWRDADAADGIPSRLAAKNAGVQPGLPEPAGCETR